MFGPLEEEHAFVPAFLKRIRAEAWDSEWPCGMRQNKTSIYVELAHWALLLSLSLYSERREKTLAVSASASTDLAGDAARRKPGSVAIIDHSETVDAPLTDLELGDLASALGKIGALLLLPPPRRDFFIAECVRGRIIRRMLEQATMAFKAGARIRLRG